MSVQRRQFLVSAAGLCATPLLLALAPAAARAAEGDAPELPAGFPRQDLALAKEMVGVSHGNVARVRELLGVSPALAGAAWDWGFGDWETALGAASHVGNREIAGLLMDHGARPDLFTLAMLGHLEAVRACVTAQPGIQKIRGPHGLTLLHHARKGGEASRPVVTYLEGLGDADMGYADAPLSEADAGACVGEYSFGAGANDRLKVSLMKDGGLGIMRYPDGATRNLFHQGHLEFHPPGNPAARIAFDLKEGRARGLTIKEGPLVVSAARLVG